MYINTLMHIYTHIHVLSGILWWWWCFRIRSYLWKKNNKTWQHLISKPRIYEVHFTITYIHVAVANVDTEVRGCMYICNCAVVCCLLWFLYRWFPLSLVPLPRSTTSHSTSILPWCTILPSSHTCSVYMLFFFFSIFFAFLLWRQMLRWWWWFTLCPCSFPSFFLPFFLAFSILFSLLFPSLFPGFFLLLTISLFLHVCTTICYRNYMYFLSIYLCIFRSMCLIYLLKYLAFWSFFCCLCVLKPKSSLHSFDLLDSFFVFLLNYEDEYLLCTCVYQKDQYICVISLLFLHIFFYYLFFSTLHSLWSNGQILQRTSVRKSSDYLLIYVFILL